MSKHFTESLKNLNVKVHNNKPYDKRVNVCSDIPDSKLHKFNVFKKLATGLDLIEREHKYQSPFIFRNTQKSFFYRFPTEGSKIKSIIIDGLCSIFLITLKARR